MSDKAHKILIVEDDKEISDMLLDFLSKNGFVADAVPNGLLGLKQVASGDYSLILLDLMLPFKSGDEFLREIRQFSDVPVIVLSAKSLTQDKIDLLHLGADDYVTKPFDLNELLARILSNIKRYSGNRSTENNVITYGKMSLNTTGKELIVNGITVSLTAKEYDLLELMLSNPKKVFSKQNLYESVWGELYAYDNDTINTHISNLRRKLKDASVEDYIETVWGIGYKMKSLEIL
jgi:DNA-binding response OmpR family regulator